MTDLTEAGRPASHLAKEGNLRIRHVLLVLVVAACGSGGERGSRLPSEPHLPPEPPPSLDVTPLTELGAATYKGFTGGLYPGGGNQPPSSHAAEGSAAVARIEPLDERGTPDPGGAIVMVTVGMSNAAQEACSGSGEPPCHPWSFIGRADVDPSVNHESLFIVNGARGGQTPEQWDSPDDPVYENVQDHELRPRDLSESQVQIAWVKEADAMPRESLPAADADAYALEAGLGRMVRAMKARWPNLRLVFFSSRVYAGYATTDLNPEPYAYESAFAVRGVIAAQIEQAATGAVDPQAGDVALARGAPWLGWGPYLWADGADPRDDGLVWLPEDFEGDGTHPSELGEAKVGALLLDFFKTSPFSQCWFLAGRSCRG